MDKSKIVIYVVMAILVAAGVYWAYCMINKESKTGSEVTVTTGSESTLDTVSDDPTSQLMKALNDVDNIDLQNHAIFTNKIFTALKDFGRPLTDRPVGRANPFAPLSAGAGGLMSNNYFASPTATTSTTTILEGI